MREILFRGKRADNGEWVEGQLLYFRSSVGENELALIVESCEWDNSNEWFNLCKRAKVIPASVSEFTGLTDKNGKKIFEGDIVKLYLIDGEEIGVIKYNDKMCRFMFFTKDGSYSFDDTDDFEVIGNIHDDPELLEGGNNNA